MVGKSRRKARKTEAERSKTWIKGAQAKRYKACFKRCVSKLARTKSRGAVAGYFDNRPEEAAFHCSVVCKAQVTKRRRRRPYRKAK
jgi:hypothetical protein